MDNQLSRRNMFAAGLASLGAGALQGEDKPLQLGIIGVGLRWKAHEAALKKLSGYNITALCDIDPARMERTNAGLPSKAATFVDYRELIKDKNVGVVVIITPGYLHHDMAIAALRAGKDVLMEKPLALNYKEAMDIKREAEKSGRIMAVGMQRRYTKGDDDMVQLVRSGAIGPVRLITYAEFRGDWNQSSTQVTDPRTGKKVIWRNLAKTSGSSELEYSIHALAHVCNVVNAPLVRVTASGGVVHYQDGRDTRDVSVVAADFANGARLDYSFSCFGKGTGGGMKVLGDKGTLTRGGDEGRGLTISTGGKAEPAPSLSKLPKESAEMIMYREFFQNIRERKPSPLSVDAALEPAKIAYGADISIRENRVVMASKDFA